MRKSVSERPRSRVARAARRFFDGLADDAPLMCGCADGNCACDGMLLLR